MLPSNFSNNTNASFSPATCSHFKCIPTLLLPEWQPMPDELSLPSRIGRALTLTLMLGYVLVGLSLVSNRFSTAVDVIVSKTRKVKVISRVTMTLVEVSIPLWNAAVAHLTLNVLGNSAPEFILTVIEVVHYEYTIGEVASLIIIAEAFNLFLTAGVCIIAAGSQSKRIEDVRNFVVSAFGALFAYLWTFIVLQVRTPKIVEPWEAVVTLLLFPIMVITAYTVDTNCFGWFAKLRQCFRKKFGKKVASTDSGSTPEETPPPLSTTSTEAGSIISKLDLKSASLEKARVEAEQRQILFIELFQTMRLTHKEHCYEKLIEMVKFDIIKNLPKTMGYYRLLAAKSWSGDSEVIINKEKLIKAKPRTEPKVFLDSLTQQIVAFFPASYKVMEDCGEVKLSIMRVGADISNTVCLRYETKDDSAKAGADYEATHGVVVFKPGESKKEIAVKIIDDEIFTDNTRFFVSLFNAELLDEWPILKSPKMNATPDVKILGNFGKAEVVIIDDDRGGDFEFESAKVSVEENLSSVTVKVLRKAGAKGKVLLPFRIVGASAVRGFHYHEPMIANPILFCHGQTEFCIVIDIINHVAVEKCVTFEVEIGEPGWADSYILSSESNVQGNTLFDKPKLGSITKVLVTITENAELRRAIEEIASIDLFQLIGSTNWKQQFVDAVKISRQAPTTAVPMITQFSLFSLLFANVTVKPPPNTVRRRIRNYLRYHKFHLLAHVLTMFWNLLCACIPPTGYMEGWFAFWVAFALIGVLIAIAMDLVILLGCCMKIKIELMVIMFLAPGVSLPDLFASRMAAMREKTADAAIVQLSSRIAVGIFVGYGLSWTIAAFKQTSQGHFLIVPYKEVPFLIVAFFVAVAIAMVCLLFRRFSPIRGELGGHRGCALASGVLFFSIWIVYILLSGLVCYCILNFEF